MEAFREARLRRWRRQAVTIARAIRAGSARAKAAPPRVPRVDGAALRDLVAEAPADAQLVEIAVKRPVWTTTSVRVAAGERVTWLSWGFAYAVKPLGIGVWPRNVLLGRVGGGASAGRRRIRLLFVQDESTVEDRDDCRFLGKRESSVAK
jgi:hypothetical protein